MYEQIQNKDTLEIIIDPQEPHGFKVKMTTTSDKGREQLLKTIDNLVSKIKEIKVNISSEVQG